MTAGVAPLYTLAANALRFDDREAAARHLYQAADDLQIAAPQLAEETRTTADTLPRMLSEDVRRVASDLRSVASDLAEAGRS